MNNYLDFIVIQQMFIKDNHGTPTNTAAENQFWSRCRF
jgi:hypothetical protein